jgi:Phasin protein
MLSTKTTFMVDPITVWEVQMSKRKPPPSKHARSSKTATKAQRAALAIVKSSKDSRLHSVVADSTEPPPKRPNETEQEPLLVENTATALQPNETKQEPHLVEDPATALEPNDTKQEALRVESPALVVEDSKQKMINKDSKKGFDFSSAAANVQAYQAKLLEVAQANMQFAFEFAQRLAAIRSPFEFLGVTAEFTSKRIAMFQKHSKEMAELSN